MSQTNFHLPDLVALCGDSFELRTNPHCYKATAASLLWTESHITVDRDMQEILPKFQFGLLAALCYPTCDYPQLKLIIDCMLYAMLDGVHDSVAYKDISGRLQRSTTPARQAGFQDKLRAFRQSRLSVSQRTQAETNLERWLEIKRDASGFLLGFALIEFASDLVLSDTTQVKAALEELTQSASDVLVWFEEIVSYNIRQARDDTSSLVTLLASAHNLPLQEAIESATTKAKAALSRFLAQERKVLENDTNASTHRYVQGLRDCIIGFAHWVYETDAYFLGQGEDVRAFGWVFLLPKSDIDPLQRWISEQKKL